MVHKAERIGRAAARAETAAALFSLVAAIIHALVTPAHLEEWWGYGLFFIFATAAQTLFALILLTDAITPDGFGANWLTVRRRILVAGIIGNLLIIGFYLVTRTVGVPFGPEAGVVESLGIPDVISKVAEVGVVAACWLALAKGPAPGANS